MKKIYTSLILLILVLGCQKTDQEPAEQETVQEVISEEPKPVIIGIDIIEKSLHRTIVSAKPKGMFITLTLEITNIGEEVVTVNETEVKLVDSEKNKYPVAHATYIYTDKSFPFDRIEPNEKVKGKLVFDVPDPDKEFTLVVKCREADIQ